jgi:hypothetical protein
MLGVDSCSYICSLTSQQAAFNDKWNDWIETEDKAEL